MRREYMGLIDAVLLCMAFCAALTGPIVYVFSGQRWWKNRIGRSRMVLFAVVVGALSKAVVTIAQGHTPTNPGWYAVIVNALIVGALTYEAYAIAATVHDYRLIGGKGEHTQDNTTAE